MSGNNPDNRRELMRLLVALLFLISVLAVIELAELATWTGIPMGIGAAFVVYRSMTARALIAATSGLWVAAGFALFCWVSPAPMNQRSARITLDVQPEYASTTIDGQPVHGTSYELEGGTKIVKIRVSFRGFFNKAYTIKIASDDIVRIRLEPSTTVPHEEEGAEASPREFKILYSNVGSAVRSHRDDLDTKASADLKKRYDAINFGDAMEQPELRASAMRSLREIKRDFQVALKQQERKRRKNASGDSVSHTPIERRNE